MAVKTYTYLYIIYVFQNSLRKYSSTYLLLQTQLYLKQQAELYKHNKL